MKKIVFATVLALASISLVSPHLLRAQDDQQITIKDPVEYDAYQKAITQTDAKAKAAALESFVQNYPQSVVKKPVLILLMGTYQGLGDADNTLSAAQRVLQIDPNNFEAILYSALIKKAQCGKTSDAQTCDDAAVLAKKGLTAAKPAATSDDDWKKQTAAAYPLFHSAIALDDVLSKKDNKAAISEYRSELMLYTDDATKSGPGLVDTLQLAEAYTKPDAKDLVQAVWFYCRAWDYAPASFKGPIEQKIDYWYKKYHGGMDGLDAIKTQAAATTFPPGTYVIPPAPTPADLAHKAVVETPDLTKLNLEDKEYILANGSKDDQDKLWAVMKGQATPVPGVVIDATTSVIKVAVSDDAKTAGIADFIVNLKTPLPDKDVPKAKDEFKLQPAAELDATYDSYTQVPATDTTAQTVQIVLKDGSIVPAEKKKPVPAHKPSAAHHAAAAH